MWILCVYYKGDQHFSTFKTKEEADLMASHIEGGGMDWACFVYFAENYPFEEAS